MVSFNSCLCFLQQQVFHMPVNLHLCILEQSYMPAPLCSEFTSFLVLALSPQWVDSRFYRHNQVNAQFLCRSRKWALIEPHRSATTIYLSIDPNYYLFMDIYILLVSLSWIILKLGPANDHRFQNLETTEIGNFGQRLLWVHLVFPPQKKRCATGVIVG